MDEAAHKLPDLKYQFHDSNLVNFDIGPGQEITLHIALYEIYYKDCPMVTVHFSGITNFESVRKFFEKIEPADEPGDYIARFDALRYDAKRPSSPGKLFFYLQLDWEGAIKIHCKNLAVSEIPNQ